jgi:hypothetical protein
MANANYGSLMGFEPKTLEQAQIEKYSSFHKAWINFTTHIRNDEGDLRFQEPHVPDHFYQYAQYLIELGYVSAVAYMSRAYDLCAIANVSEESIRAGRQVLAKLTDWDAQMERARKRAKELLTITIQQAKPFRLQDVRMMAPQLAAPFLLALSSGCRPKALYNCTFNSYQNCANTGLTRVVLAGVPRDKFCEGRVIRIFCTCLNAGTPQVFCPIHGESALGNFALPLQKNVLTRAIKSHYLDTTVGYSAYSARRATACALAQLVQTEEGKQIKNLLDDYPSCKARINTQFGWCPKSDMLLHYCKGHFALEPWEKVFYFPLYMFIRYGLTQDQLGESFIVNLRGDSRPPPQQESDPLIGPTTKSSEVNTKSVLVLKQKGKRVPLIGEAAARAETMNTSDRQAVSYVADNIALDMPRRDSRASISSTDAGNAKQTKRGRKKGGTNRTKKEIIAEKEAKAKKAVGRPARGIE